MVNFFRFWAKRKIDWFYNVCPWWLFRVEGTFRYEIMYRWVLSIRHVFPSGFLKREKKLPKNCKKPVKLQSKYPSGVHVKIILRKLSFRSFSEVCIMLRRLQFFLFFVFFETTTWRIVGDKRIVGWQSGDLNFRYTYLIIFLYFVFLLYL